MEYLRLDEICNLNMGQSPESDSYNQEKDGIPFFQGNADFGEMYPIARVWCNKPIKVVDRGTLLISVRAPIGALNFATEKSCIGRGLAGITVKSRYELKYIYYALKFKNEELNTIGIGSTFKAISKSSLGEVMIRDMPIKNQEECVKKLDLVYKMVIEEKEQIKQFDALIKSRFVEMFGDMLLNPMGWPESRLDAMAQIVSGITKGRKIKDSLVIEVPYMSVSNVKDGYIDWTTVKTIMATPAEIDQYKLLPYDVLMTEGGDPDKLGRGAVIHEPPKNCIHQNHIFRVRLDKETLLPEFMEQYLQHQRAKRYFLRCAKQTTGIASINMKQLTALPILVPPMFLQIEFRSFLGQVDKLKFA